MRYSQLFGQTLREPPADSPSAGLALLARAGYLRFPNTLLPLGQKTYDRLSLMIETQLKMLGGQEISTEADVFALAESEIQSYRQLPRVLYSRGFPSITVSVLAASEDKRNELTSELLAKFKEVVSSLKTPAMSAESGSIYSFGQGDSSLLKCPSCGYLESQELVERQATSPLAEPLLPTEKVLTPDCPTIEDLAQFLKIPESKTAKALMLMAKYAGKEEFLFVVLRGDTSLSPAKLGQAIGAREIYPATEEQIRAAGAEPGYASPIGLKNVRVIVDKLVPASTNLVAGANEHGYHLLNTNYGRDYSASTVCDLVAAEAGDPCPKCQTPLESLNAKIILNSEKPGSLPNSGSFTDEKGQSATVWHARIRIEMIHLLITAAESHHDDKGLTLPDPIAPYVVYLVALPGKTMDTHSIAETVYNDLRSAGISVLYDDRDERAGVKFNDADLIGCPVRITLGERNLQNGMVEFKRRRQPDSELILLAEIISHLKNNG